MPMVLPGVGSYADLTVARVDMRLAHPKVIPVVTANWPTKLNHPVGLIRYAVSAYESADVPVIQEKKAAWVLFGANIAAQKYGPPEVGWALVISAILRAMKNEKNETTIQPTLITPGPPVFNPYENSVVIPV